MVHIFVIFFLPKATVFFFFLKPDSKHCFQVNVRTENQSSFSRKAMRPIGVPRPSLLTPVPFVISDCGRP